MTDQTTTKSQSISLPATSVFDKIVAWANDRNLVQGATPQAQMLKMTEEVGELAAAIARNNEQGIVDSIGDCVVVLTILAAQHGLFIEHCISEAYNEIKDRKGKMHNGIFIREVP